MFKDDLCMAMEKEKVTVKDLSDYLGVSQHTIDNWRSGESLPRKKRLNDVCDLFNLPKDSYIKEYEDSYKEVNRSPIGFIFDGNKLKTLRMQKEWSQKQVGECIGVSNKAVGNWECGFSQPGLTNLRTLCGIFGVHEEYFKKKEKSKTEEVVVVNTITPTPSKREVVEKQNALETLIDSVFIELENRIEALEDLVNQYCRNVEELKKHVDEISIFDVERDTRLSDLEDNINIIDSDLRNIKQQVNLKSDSNQALSDALKALSSVILKGGK